MSAKTHFDCIVIGFGGLGSSALYAATQKGWDVLGIDQFGAVHDQGSSHGQSRIIRTAYFEHPNYVPMAKAAFQKWDELDRYTRANHPPNRKKIDALIQRTGLLQVGAADGEVIAGTLRSASTHGLDVETLTPAEIESRYPVLKVNPDHVGVYESEAGLLRVENCVAAMLNIAKKKGAQLKSNTPVKSWTVNDQGKALVQTEDGTLTADRLIVTAGTWSGGLLADLNLDFEIIQKQQHWFQIDRVEVKVEAKFPCFLIETDGGCFYGFPQIDNLGMKVAEHSGGKRLSHPSEVDRGLCEKELQLSERFLEESFIYGRRRFVHHSVCMYTMSSDQHFIIDRHPKFENVVFAGGMSGHGFKFAPVIGEQLVNLLSKEENETMDFLKLSRFAASE